MRQRAIRFLVLLPCLVAGLVGFAAKGGPPQETPVSVTFWDADSDRIKSDDCIQCAFGAAYVHEVDGVRAVLVSNGNLALKTHDTASEEVRELFLDFHQPEDPNTPPPPFGPSITRQGFMSTVRCENDGGLREMRSPSEQLCSLTGYFNVPGTNTQWFIRFDLDNYPDTDKVLVKRLDETTWTIEAVDTDVAKLLSAPVKGKLVLTPYGNYHMPTHLTVKSLP